MTYVATSLSGSDQKIAAPRMARVRSDSDQPMIASNPALNRVNGGLRVGGNNKALLAGVGVAALLLLGGGTWYLSQHSSTVRGPVAVLAAPTGARMTGPAVNTLAQPSTDVVAPAASQPVASARSVTPTSVFHAKPTPVRVARARAPEAAGGLSANLAPQPQAVTPPVISPAPEAIEPVAPVISEAAPAPTAIQPAQPTATPPSSAPAPTEAPSAPQPQA